MTNCFCLSAAGPFFFSFCNLLTAGKREEEEDREEARITSTSGLGELYRKVPKVGALGRGWGSQVSCSPSDH